MPVEPQVPCSRDPLEMFSHFFDEDVLSSHQNYQKCLSSLKVLEAVAVLLFSHCSVHMHVHHAHILCICMPTFIGWIDTTSYTNSCSVTISRVEEGEEGKPIHISRSIVVSSDFTWHILVNEKVISSTLEVFFGLPQTIATAQDVLSVVQCVDSLALCVGNRDTKFLPLIAAQKGSFHN